MNRSILRLAIPNIISNLSVPLLGAVDTALVGHLDDVAYIGALAIGSVIFNFIFWGFGFLRMGTTGLTAQEYGKRNRKEMMMILARVQLIAMGVGLTILFLQNPIALLSLWMIESTADVGKYTRIYFDIRIYTAPAVLALYGINGWFLGMQNAAYPMIVTITHNLLNIVLNVLFIYGLGMHVDGVAYGTLISTYLALVLAFLLYFKKYSHYLPHFASEALLNVSRLKEYFTVNRDIFIRTLCLIFTFSFFTAVSSTQGEIILAANTILLQYWFIVSYGIDGFAYAAESLVGRFKGSGNNEKLKKSVVYTTTWGLLIGLTGTLIYGFFGSNLLTLFTNKLPVISHAETVLIWTILAPVVSAFCYILDGVFIGATETGPMRNTMLISTFAVFLPAYYLLTDLFGVHGLWLAMLLFMLSRGAALGLYLRGTVLNKSTA